MIEKCRSWYYFSCFYPGFVGIEVCPFNVGLITLLYRQVVRCTKQEDA